ncbi:MAG: ABC transporter permease [Proteobacteria bacterium]|nr:ABC transporter permease [Pseudomonadota bacterium]
MTPHYAAAFNDLREGIRNWPIWGRLGWQEVKRRYRRTVFGPFWATISIGMFIGGMSFIYAPLFNTTVSTYLPWLTTGLVSWSLIAALINEGTGTYTAGVGIITTLNFPYSILNFMVIWRNVIVFFHNLLIVIVVVLALGVPINSSTLLIIPGLAIIALNGIWITMILGMVSARYRDIPQLVGNLTQILMFVTPVFWVTSSLGDRGHKVTQANYVFHLVEVLRQPMLGQTPTLMNYAVTLGGAALGMLVALFLFARFRRRIPYWL